jgi:hypothetical protein
MAVPDPPKTCKTCAKQDVCTLVANLPQLMETFGVPDSYPLPMPCGGKEWELKAPTKGFSRRLFANLAEEAREEQHEPVREPKKGTLGDLIP